MNHVDRVVRDPTGLTHYVEVGDPIGHGVPMCGYKRSYDLRPGAGSRGVCMHCRDADRRLLPDGEYRPTRRSS